MELLKLINEGYEYSVQWKGVGGLTSVFSFLEIAHRYFCGKRYKDDSTTENNADSAVKSSSSNVENVKGKTHRLLGDNNDAGSSDSLHFHRG